MSNNTTNTALKTNLSTADVITFCFWDTSSIFQANFMFPTEHFTDVNAINVMDEKEFCELIETILTPCQPLRDVERSALSKSVHSGNRLRVYYQAYNLAASALQLVNDLQVNDSEIGSLDDKKLVEAFEYRGHSILEEIDQPALNNFNEVEDIYTK